MKTKHGNGSKQPGDQTAVRKLLLRVIPGLLLGLCGSASAADEVGAGSSGNYFKVGGYVRAWASFNLKDQPDTPNFDDKGKAQMERASLSLTADAKTGGVTWKAVGRADTEARTSYES